MALDRDASVFTVTIGVDNLATVQAKSDTGDDSLDFETKLAASLNGDSDQMKTEGGVDYALYKFRLKTTPSDGSALNITTQFAVSVRDIGLGSFSMGFRTSLTLSDRRKCLEGSWIGRIRALQRAAAWGLRHCRGLTLSLCRMTALLRPMMLRV